MSEQIDNRIKDANKKAVDRIQSSGPVLMGKEEHNRIVKIILGTKR